MKKIIVFIAMLLVNSSFAQSRMNMHQLVNYLFDAMNQHNAVAIAQLYAENAEIESPNWEGVKKGAASAQEIYSRYFTSSPDLKYIITGIYIDSATVIVEYTSDGTMLQLEANTPKYMLGKHYTLKNITRLQIVNEKIIRSVTYFDQVAFLRQVGFFDQK